MNRPSLAFLIVITLLVSARSTAAQTATPATLPNDAECRAVLAERYPDVLKDPQNNSNFCGLLAGQIYTLLTAAESDRIFTTGVLRVADFFSTREFQSRATQQAAAGGTPAQAQALPGVQPTGVAAGTIAAVGTRAGQDALAALSLNPAVLFLADSVSRRLARASRIADVTFFIPVSGLTGETSATQVRYAGARVRLNLLGQSSGDAVWRGAETLLKQQAVQSARFVAYLTETLGVIDDVDACVAAMQPNAPLPDVDAPPPCRGVDTRWTLDAASVDALREQLTAIRRRADAQYLGADVRFDVGDPTLGEVADASGKFTFVGIGAGKRFGAGTRDRTSGVRMRFGVRHALLDNETGAQWAAEGGVGYELTRFLYDESEVNASVAVEFRRGGAPDGEATRYQTDFTMLRGSLSVPLAGGSISINAGRPLTGDVSPVFSVNFNWGLLLSNAIGK